MSRSDEISFVDAISADRYW